MQERYIVDNLNSPCPNRTKYAYIWPSRPYHMLEIRVHTFGSSKSKEIRFIIGVGNPHLFILSLFWLVSRVHDLESILTNKLIISIHQHLHIIFITEVEPCIDDIISSKSSLKILHIFHSILREFHTFQVFYCTLHIGVCGIIVYEHNMIVLILLLNDWFQYFYVPVILHIVMA